MELIVFTKKFVDKWIKDWRESSSKTQKVKQKLELNLKNDSFKVLFCFVATIQSSNIDFRLLVNIENVWLVFMSYGKAVNSQLIREY